MSSQSHARHWTHQGIYPLIMLAAVAFIAYANAWPNTLAWDDTLFSMENRAASVTLTEAGRFFTSDVWASTGKASNLYRPLLMLSVALDIQMFGSWFSGYHLVNILLHIMVSISVFGLVRYLLQACVEKTTLASQVALLSALIFAVHPIHAEVVNSIFNRSDLLVALGVVGGLWWFLPTVAHHPVKAWSILGLIYFMALLCKETAVVLPTLAVLFIWMVFDESWQKRLRRCIPVLFLILPLGLYFVLRINALELAGVDDAALGSLNPPVDDTDSEIIETLDAGKLLPAVKVWFDSIKLTLWPDPLLASHGESITNGWLAGIAQMALLTVALVLNYRRSPFLLLGLAFFYLTILPPSRIIGGGGALPRLAERHVYTPSVGLTIILAFGLYWLARRFGLKLVVAVSLAVAIVLTPVTWSRNADWASTLTLAERDYAKNRKAGQTLNTFVNTLLLEGKSTRAAAICDEHNDAFETQWSLSTSCGKVYQDLKRYKQAEEAYVLALGKQESKATAHFLLAHLYLGLDRKNHAKEQFELAIAREQKAFMKEFLKAETLIGLYPSNRTRLLEARTYLEKTLELQPQFYKAQKQIIQLDAKLGY